MHFSSARALSFSMALVLSSLNFIPAYAHDDKNNPDHNPDHKHDHKHDHNHDHNHDHDHNSNKALDDVLGGVVLGVLGAAIVQQSGSDDTEHQGGSKEANEVGICMHHVENVMSKQGYYAVDYEKTLSYEVNSDGINLIDLEVARSAHSNDERTYIKAKCAIQNGKVVNFHYSNF